MSVTIKGSTGVTFPDASEQGKAARTKTLSVDQFMHVQDQKPSGTAGGTFTSGAWRTRDLNTVLTNTIAGASLAANSITLPEGEYWVEAQAPAIAVDRHQARLRGASSTYISGTSEYNNGADANQTKSLMLGLMTIGSGGDDITIQHQCQTTEATSGFGSQCGSVFTVDHETYTDIKIWKVA